MILTLDSICRFFNSCPDTDPAQVPFFDNLGYLALQSSNCMTNLTSNVDCTALPYNYTDAPGPANDTDTFYIADNIPANGTEALSDNPGDLTTPISGETLTWTFAGGTTVATAVPYNAQAAASTTPGAAASGGGGGTTTSTGGTAAPTKKSGGIRVTGAATRAICIAMAVGFMFLA